MRQEENIKPEQEITCEGRLYTNGNGTFFFGSNHFREVPFGLLCGDKVLMIIKKI